MVAWFLMNFNYDLLLIKIHQKPSNHAEPEHFVHDLREHVSLPLQQINPTKGLRRKNNFGKKFRSSSSARC
jgi:hypothetical protein